MDDEQSVFWPMWVHVMRELDEEPMVQNKDSLERLTGRGSTTG